MTRLVLLAPLICGCAGARPVPPAISWPPPPERARVIYRGEIRGEREVVEPSAWQRLTSLVLGTREPDVLQSPFAAAFDGASRLLVTDRARGAVVIIDRDRGDYRVLAPRGERSLLLPVGVAADAQGRIYVADAGRKVVTVLSPDGEPIGRIDAGGALQRPSGVAIDQARGLLYVADTPAHVVRVLTLDGVPVRVLGGHGSGTGEMNFPTFVAVDAGGRVLINDTMNFRVEIFDAGGSFVRAFGGPGNGSGDLDRPKGIAADASGRVYVADASFDNFQIFDAEGRLLLFVGEHGRGPGQFWMPAGLAVADGHVAVVDTGNARVLFFDVVAAGEVP
jgi:DNA-binding beta-propeller fold protein YncE